MVFEKKILYWVGLKKGLPLKHTFQIEFYPQILEQSAKKYDFGKPDCLSAKSLKLTSFVWFFFNGVKALKGSAERRKKFQKK